MAELNKIVQYLDTLLYSDKYDDYAVNGLQVEGKKDVSVLALGVSASLKLFQKARTESADAVLVHHGLLWKASHPMRIKSIFKNRIKFLLKNDMSLLAYHLPLDGHKKYGNNILIAKKLGLKDLNAFAKHGSKNIGIIGKLPKAVSFSSILNKTSHIFGQITANYCFSQDKIQRIAIVSGGADKDFLEATEKGADLYITGEFGEPVQEIARETGKSFISCGHYVTERFGLLKLEKVLRKKFSLKTVFIDIPNKA